MTEAGESIAIPENELTFTSSRSSGPGGQNVNKVSTKVTARFRVSTSAVLTDEQKEKILIRLAPRINRDGILQVTSQRHRTQAANRNDALKRLSELIAGALRDDPARKQTRVPQAVKKRRLEEKVRRSRVKRQRSLTDHLLKEDY